MYNKIILYSLLNILASSFCQAQEIKSVNGVNYELTYRPTDLLVEQELGQSKDVEKIARLREKYGKYLYFNLSMSINNNELLSTVADNQAKFGHVLRDLTFGMEEKINVYTIDKDTIPMADFVYSRMFGMTKSTSIMIVYPNEKKYLEEEYLNFTVEDLGFDTGEVKFKIKTKAILNQPKLRFN